MTRRKTLSLALLFAAVATLSLSLSLMTTSADAATCPNEPLRVGRSAALPGCRA